MSDRDAQRREGVRRRLDDVRLWVPIVLSLVATMLSLGMMYGRLSGRLDLIEYRLCKIETGSTAKCEH